MKNKLTQRLFIVIVLAYFTGMAMNSWLAVLLFKPLLTISLWLCLHGETTRLHDPIKIWAGAALLFSMAGDTLLMFTEKSDLFFLAGLACFLIAHICYIVCFHQIKTRENLKGHWPWAIVVAIYYFLITSFLRPHLGDMKIPVFIYGAVISFMLFLALLLYELPAQKTSGFILSGALLFVISDSILAINKFYQPIVASGWLIMVTYIGAQYLLIRGVTCYLNSSANN